MLTHERADTGDIVLRQAVIRIDDESAFRPLFSPINLAKNRQTDSSQVGRSRVAWMQQELALSARHTFPRRLLHLLLTPEGSVDSSEHKQRLIIIRLKLC